LLSYPNGLIAPYEPGASILAIFIELDFAQAQMSHPFGARLRDGIDGLFEVTLNHPVNFCLANMA
jgi:hypothetical protein